MLRVGDVAISNSLYCGLGAWSGEIIAILGDCNGTPQAVVLKSHDPSMGDPYICVPLPEMDAFVSGKAALN